MKVAILSCEDLKDKLLLDMENVTHITKKQSLLEYDVLINPLGEYVDYDLIKDIIEFYNKGGIIINLSSYAYTVPYYLKNGVIKIKNTTVDVIRSFGTVDSYIPYEKEHQEGIAKASNSKYQYLEKYFKDIKSYHKICHLEHNLGREYIEDSTGYYDKAIYVCNRLENLVSLEDKKGNICCSLISKTMEIDKGVIYNFNFDTSSLNLNDLLKEFIEREYKSNIYVYAQPEFARYEPNENIDLLVSTYYTDKFNNLDDLRLDISIYNDIGEVKFTTTHTKIDKGNLCKISIPPKPEGLYKINVEIKYKDIVLDIKETGVLIIEEGNILKECKKYKRLVIDKNISTEFHVQDGEVIPLHGTAYFVSDVMRKCFYHMNPYLCEKEMREIANQGYNVIRSGFWYKALGMYGEDGEFTKRGIRAVQTFFYTALKNNITVQFAVGCVELNCWNTQKSALHDPEIMNKSIKMVSKFLHLFKDYTNVQLEIINEPSYSRSGAWRIARPSYDENEKKNYIEWLRKKYNNRIEELCDNWGIVPYEIKDFSDIKLPGGIYERPYFRTETTINYIQLTDFFEFARESFSKWCGMIRECGRKIAPDVIFTMPLDEIPRVPCEQEEYLLGNIDTINWHQWNQSSIAFTQCLLSKIPHVICCSGEQGVYKYENLRNEKSLTDTEVSELVEKKLLYSLGNFVQWQWNNDPFMRELSENNIGIIRNDGSKMPIVDKIRELMQKEDKMAKFEKGKELSNTKIFVIHPTSEYFFTDYDITKLAVRNSINTLVYKQKQHVYTVLEHTLKYYSSMLNKGGNLLVLPSANVIRDDVWEDILNIVKSGNNILITGSIERNNYWIEKNRLRAIDESMKLMPVNMIERIKIGQICDDISFKKVIGYSYAPNVFEKCCHEGMNINVVNKFNIGKGTIYYCPVPVEIADQEYIINHLYEYVLNDTKTQSEVFTLKDKECHGNIFIYPQRFEQCTVYTIVNEGEDDVIDFCDLRSNKEFNIKVNSNRGVKLWIDVNGEIMEVYK